jgi:hypothetical protein
MFRNIMEDIGGVGLYGLISLLTFFTVFTVMVIWAMRLKKPYIKSMSNLPLDSDSPSAHSGEHRHV